MNQSEQKLTIKTISSGYDPDIIIDWIKQLDFFSFYKSGLIGHLADSDSFIMDIKYLNKKDLLNTLRLLGLRFRLQNRITPKLISGIEYSDQDLMTPPNSSKEFHDIECNFKNHIGGISCNLSIPKGYIHCSIHRLPHEKDSYILSEKEFNNAYKIENIIRETGLENRITKEFQKYIGYVDRDKLDLILK